MRRIVAKALRQERLTGLFDALTAAHAFAPQPRKSLIVVQPVRLNERHDSLDDETPAVTPSVVFGQAQLHGEHPAIIVHTEKQCRVDRTGVNRLAKKTGDSRFCQKSQPARRLDSNDAYGGRYRKSRSADQHGCGIERKVAIDQQHVAVWIKRGEINVLETRKRNANFGQCFFERLGGGVRPAPQHGAIAAKILDQPLTNHDTTRSFERDETAPKRDEF
jgi:hypothetical protein